KDFVHRGKQSINKLRRESIPHCLRKIATATVLAQVLFKLLYKELRLTHAVIGSSLMIEISVDRQCQSRQTLIVRYMLWQFFNDLATRVLLPRGTILQVDQ